MLSTHTLLLSFDQRLLQIHNNKEISAAFARELPRESLSKDQVVAWLIICCALCWLLLCQRRRKECIAENRDKQLKAPSKNAAAEENKILLQKVEKLEEFRAAYHLTTLRSPRHHVFSMFMHCKYHKREKKGRWKEHSGLSPKGDMDDYKIWLDYHVPMGPENRAVPMFPFILQTIRVGII